MKTVTRFILLAAAAMMVSSASAYAQATATANVTVTAQIGASAKLDLGGVTEVIFANADPDAFPVISASAINVTAKAKTSQGSTVTLAISADGPLTDGGATIAESNIDWLASGAGFQAGTLAQTDVTLGSWTNSGQHAGTQTYRLQNSWSYATGDYQLLVTYTLTAP